MEKGWIKLWRKSLNSQIFRNEGLWKVWTWSLLKANHKEEIWEQAITGRGKTEVPVKRGQFIFGRNTASKELNMNPSTVWKRIVKLEKLGNLNIQSNTHYSLVTIANWDLYQGEEIKVTSKVTGKEQASNTNKNVKNVKKEKNTTAATQKIFFSLKEKKWEEITAGDINAWAETYPACNIEIELRRMREWLLANPDKKKKNYRRFIVNWLARSQDNGGTKNIKREEKVEWEK